MCVGTNDHQNRPARRCPGQSGERRRAYQRGRYSKLKAQELFNKMVWPDETYARERSTASVPELREELSGMLTETRQAWEAIFADTGTDLAGDEFLPDAMARGSRQAHEEYTAHVIGTGAVLDDIVAARIEGEQIDPVDYMQALDDYEWYVANSLPPQVRAEFTSIDWQFYDVPLAMEAVVAPDIASDDANRALGSLLDPYDVNGYDRADMNLTNAEFAGYLQENEPCVWESMVAAASMQRTAEANKDALCQRYTAARHERLYRQMCWEELERAGVEFGKPWGGELTVSAAAAQRSSLAEIEEMQGRVDTALMYYPATVGQAIRAQYGSIRVSPADDLNIQGGFQLRAEKTIHTGVPQVDLRFTESGVELDNARVAPRVPQAQPYFEPTYTQTADGGYTTDYALRRDTYTREEVEQAIDALAEHKAQIEVAGKPQMIGGNPVGALTVEEVGDNQYRIVGTAPQNLTSVDVSPDVSTADVSAAIHEVGHITETVVPPVAYACKTFVRSRREQAAARDAVVETQLPDGTRSPMFYGPFTSPYASRDYAKTPATEVFSTGMEQLFASDHDGQKRPTLIPGAAGEYPDDPAHRQLVLGLLAFCGTYKN